MKRLLPSVLCLLAATLVRAEELPFDFETLQYRAKALASKPYEKPVSPVTDALRALTYDQYRDIRFNPEKAWWGRERAPFQLQFFHPGFIYDQTVQVSELVDDRPRPVPFNTDLFTYGPSTRLDGVPGNVGFTGFRIHYALNSTAYLDELAVFQGASYFRALGKGMRYGLSARGLALNSGEPGGEEFPVFREFWVRKPTGGKDDAITVYALMDSPSVAGAYRFVIRPGPSTVMEVRMAVYRRRDAGLFGVAPLTSMFWYGEATGTRHGDFRPEVHDSDGLLLERGSGEWFWRPLVNPASIRSTSFHDENPRGFGLVQRDRAFASYEDLEAHYHERPSLWVEPVGSWGRGHVRLVELPTPDETNDNIVAFWVPAELPEIGKPLVLEYRLHWFMEGQPGARRPPSGTAVATRIGRSKTHEPDLIRFAVDFDSAYLSRQPSDPAISPEVSVGQGATLVHQGLQKNPYNGTWRLAFSIRPDGSGRPVELRAFLRKPPHTLTETWSYLWTP